jgi:hypothetical protein
MYIPVFWKNMLALSSGHFLPEDGGAVFLCIHLQDYMVKSTIWNTHHDEKLKYY